MTHSELATIVIDTSFQIHSQYGSGLLESAYEAILAYELRKRGLSVQTQHPIALTHNELHIEVAYRADLLVEGKLLVELKAAERLAPVFGRQILTYLRLSNLRLGLVINFGAEHLKDGLLRVSNNCRD